MKRVVEFIAGLVLVLAIIGACIYGFWWMLCDIRGGFEKAKSVRELCYSAGYSELRDGWCVDGVDAPVLVESLGGDK